MLSGSRRQTRTVDQERDAVLARAGALLPRPVLPDALATSQSACPVRRIDFEQLSTRNRGDIRVLPLLDHTQHGHHRE